MRRVARTLTSTTFLAVLAVCTGTLNAAPRRASLNPASLAPASRAPRACPAEMAAIPSESGGFCIDRYEAAVVELTRGGATPLHSPFEPVNGKTVKAITRKGIVPQGYISGVEAKSACENAGKRLCTPQEWQRACMGKAPTKYPYGDDEVPGRCNADGRQPHPVNELFGPGTEPFYDPAKMNDPRINQLPNTVARTGAHPKCKSAYGVYDMVGNLHEWTASPSGQFNGGYYMDTHRNGDGCFYKTTAHPMTYRDYSTGFRCCA